jgi:hypothetical protein
MHLTGSPEKNSIKNRWSFPGSRNKYCEIFCFNLEFMEIVRFIVMSVEFAWMSNFVEITNVVKTLPMMNVAFVWR